MSRHITNLGQVLISLAIAEVDEIIMHEDVSAWGAPSECHGDVSRGEEARMKHSVTAAKRLAKTTFAEIARQAKQRGGISINCAHPKWQALIGRIHAKRSPF